MQILPKREVLGLKYLPFTNHIWVKEHLTLGYALFGV